MPQVVPSKASVVAFRNYTRFYGCGAKIILSTNTCRTRNPALCLGGCKDPVGVAMVRRFTTPGLESFGQDRMHGDPGHTVFGLSWCLFSFRPATRNMDLTVLPIDLHPLQPESFLGSKCCRGVNKSQRPLQPGLRSVEFIQNHDHLFRSYDNGFVTGTRFGARQRHRIGWTTFIINGCRKQLVTLCVPEYLGHERLDFPNCSPSQGRCFLALRRCQSFKPLFDFEWLDITRLPVSPTWQHPVYEVQFIDCFCFFCFYSNT